MNLLKNKLWMLMIAIGFAFAFFGGRWSAPKGPKADSGQSAEESTRSRETTSRGSSARSERGRGEKSSKRVAGEQEVFHFSDYQGVQTPAGAKLLLEALLRSMEVDPERTLQFAKENKAVLGEEGIQSLLLKWSGDQPERAWAVAKEQYPESADEVLGEIAKSEPKLALQLARELGHDDPLDAQATLSEIIRGAYYEGGYGDAVGLIDLLTEDDLAGATDSSNKASLYQVVLDEWTRFSPKEAAQWVESFADDGSGTKTEVQQALIENWTHHDPNAALKYFLNDVSEGDFRVDGITSSLTAWAGKDIQAASGWIIDNGRSTEFDEAAYHVALSGELMDVSPESSLEWMRSVADSELQNKGIGKVYGRWLRQDPEAAGAHLEAAGEIIPEGLRASIKATYQIDLEREQSGAGSAPNR